MTLIIQDSNLLSRTCCVCKVQFIIQSSHITATNDFETEHQVQYSIRYTLIMFLHEQQSSKAQHVRHCTSLRLPPFSIALHTGITSNETMPATVETNNGIITCSTSLSSMPHQKPIRVNEEKMELQVLHLKFCILPRVSVNFFLYTNRWKSTIMSDTNHRHFFHHHLF